MEKKFFRPLSVKDMLAINWGDITTRTWAWSEFTLGDGEFDLGLEQAIWFLGTIKEINTYCMQHSRTVLRLAPGGPESTQQFSALAKGGVEYQVIIQLRAHMLGDRPRAGIGVKTTRTPCPSFRIIKVLVDEAIRTTR